MVGITSAGVGSGLDLESIISATIQAADVPKQQIFAKKQSEVTLELSAIGELKSAASALQDVVKKIADIDNFNKRIASIEQPSSGDVISVEPSSNATSGSFDVEVNTLAQGSRAVSNDSLFTDSSDVVTATGGQLTLTAGSETFNITLSANATLADLRNAVNDAEDNFGVTANIINTGSQARLVFNSSITGTGNDLTITNNISELDNVSTTAFGGGSGGLTIAAEDQAQDAEILIDNISVTSNTNTFINAIEDITITVLKQTDAGEKATVSVDTDKESVNELIDKFVAEYNNLIGMISFKGRDNQALGNDPIIRSFKSQLYKTLSSQISDAGNFSSIYEIGLSLDRDGYLEKSTLGTSLSDNLATNYDDVGQAFAGESGIAKEFETLLEGYLNSSGVFKQRENNLDIEQKRLDKDIEQHEYRMTLLEERLRAQYTGLDTLLAEMKATQNYLSAQLASLPGMTTKKQS